MLSFLNIRWSLPDVSYKEEVLLKISQNLLKSICAAACTLIKFQAKGL